MRLLKLTPITLALLGVASFSACGQSTTPTLNLGGSGGSGTSDTTSQASGGLATDPTGDDTGMGGQNLGGSNTDIPAVLGGPCSGDDECQSIGALCDERISACVTCISDEDCDGNTECTSGTCTAFTACESSLNCEIDQVCDKSNGRCVECVGSNDCEEGESCVNERCSANCSSDKDCTPDGQVCDTTASACVDCLTQADCSDGMRCDEGACLPGVCSQGQGKCSGDVLLACNSTATGYDRVSCDNGCDAEQLVCDGESQGDGSCDPRVRILVQRSGTMFEYPSAEDNLWDGVAAAFDGSDSGVLNQFAKSVDISLSTFHMAADEETCPALSTKTSVGSKGLSDFFDDEAQAHNEITSKVDAPLADAIAQATSELGSKGDRYLLLIITGLPDSCSVQDGLCAIDPTLVQVQKAHQVGVVTKLLYLPSATNPIEGYPEAVANAGAGQGVSTLHTGCDAEAASYSETNGNASFQKPDAVDGIQGALSKLLGDINACN